MADLTGAIGERKLNSKHDVALVQAMLGLVSGPHHRSYYTGFYDGMFLVHTRNAITAFQNDYHTCAEKKQAAPPAGRLPMDHNCVIRPGQGPRATLPSNLDDAGAINPGAATILKMNELLPKDYKDITAAPGTRVVYFPDLPGPVAAYAKSVETDKTLDEDFRKVVATLIRRMFDKHKILLTITSTGGLRTFQKQYEIHHDHPTRTKAGPGESNHNFGKAVDIGFNQFEWLQVGGNSVVDDWWLNKLTKFHKDRAAEMWKIRDAIAFDEIGMYPSKLPGDDIHIQSYSDDDVSMVKSLAALLDKKGTFSWQWNHGYESDLGFGGAFHHVGKSSEIWDGSCPMHKQWIATGKGIPVHNVLDSDVKSMRAALRADFEAAEAGRDDWEPVPH